MTEGLGKTAFRLRYWGNLGKIGNFCLIKVTFRCNWGNKAADTHGCDYIGEGCSRAVCKGKPVF